MNKTILITGASRGMGYAIAKEFEKNGWDLIVTCHSNIKMLGDFKNARLKFMGDLSDYSNIENLFKKINELHITIDVLVNNAGICYMGLLQDMTPENWSDVINTNLTSAFYMSKNIIPLMLKNHSGHIINISSVWGSAGASMEVAYSASKGGLNAFTKALAKELAPSNISVNAIACGLVDTDMNKCLSLEDLTAVIKEIPASRMANASEIADFVYKLSCSTTYLTGQIITVDGGWI